MESYKTEIRPGIQSLFVEPARYKDYIPILAAIEEDSLSNPDRIKSTFRRVFKDELEPKLIDDICIFVDHCYKVGEHIKDWDIDWSGLTDFGWERSDGKEPLTPDEIEKKGMKKVSESINIQWKLLNIYLDSKKRR